MASNSPAAIETGLDKRVIHPSIHAHVTDGSCFLNESDTPRFNNTCEIWEAKHGPRYQSRERIRHTCDRGRYVHPSAILIL